MILLALFILLLIIAPALTPANDSYEEYCKLECWSIRRPCCRTS